MKEDLISLLKENGVHDLPDEWAGSSEQWETVERPVLLSELADKIIELFSYQKVFTEKEGA